jgi:hypothetical protein
MLTNRHCNNAPRAEFLQSLLNKMDAWRLPIPARDLPVQRPPPPPTRPPLRHRRVNYAFKADTAHWWSGPGASAAALESARHQHPTAVLVDSPRRDDARLVITSQFPFDRRVVWEAYVTGEDVDDGRLHLFVSAPL